LAVDIAMTGESNDCHAPYRQRVNIAIDVAFPRTLGVKSPLEREINASIAS